MSNKPTFNEARDAYVGVLGTGFGASTVNLILRILAGQKVNGDHSQLFRDQVYQLKTMTIGKGDTPIVDKSGRAANVGKYITSGASGVVYLGLGSGIIYKKITITLDAKLKKEGDIGAFYEEQVKEAFLEAYFQTVLSLDKAYGKHIGKISNFYRDPSLVKSGGKDWWQTQKTATFYITMENIPNSFKKMLQAAAKSSGGSATIAAVKPRLSQLAEVLGYLNTAYGFRHRDLHSGNVMFTDDMSVKIIDFGRCCINFEWSPGQTALYTMDKWGADDIPAPLLNGGNETCFSLDHFIFLISVLQDPEYETLCSYSLNKMLNALVTSTRNQDDNLFYYLRSRSESHPPGTYSPFWDSYPWSFSSWSPKMITALTQAPCFTLASFKSFVDGASDAQYPEPARAASAGPPARGPKAAGHTGPRGGSRKLRTKRRRNVRRKTRRY